MKNKTQILTFKCVIRLDIISFAALYTIWQVEHLAFMTVESIETNSKYPPENSKCCCPVFACDVCMCWRDTSASDTLSIATSVAFETMLTTLKLLE